MKQLLSCLVLVALFSCNSTSKESTSETPVTTQSNDASGKGTGEMKDGISDYTNNKESFMLTCHVDASNALGGENTAQVDQFCECAWEKTKGKYPGAVVANDAKLEKDPVLKGCYENAKKK